jgi:site-specific recombinase XerD
MNASARTALVKLRALYPKDEMVAPLGYSSAHRRWWVSVRKAAKLNDLRWHDLRHTFATRLVDAGVDIFVVNSLMRHSKKSLSVTMRYAHLSDKRLKREIVKLDAPQKVIQVTDTTRELVQ